VATTDGARARMAELRGALAVTNDAPGRARLRVRLADVLAAAGEVEAAASELERAAGEAPPSAGLLLSAGAVASRLSPEVARVLVDAIAAARTARTARAGAAAPAAAAPVGRAQKARTADDGARAAAPDRAAGAAATRSVATPLPGPGGPVGAAQPPVPAPSPAIAWEPPQQARAPRPVDRVAEAFGALVEGKPVRARRLGEEAARLGDGRRAARLGDLVVALREHGAKRQALLLSRTLIESGAPPVPASSASPAPTSPAVAGGEPRAALRALADEAEREGAADLGRRWRIDLGLGPAAGPPPRRADGKRETATTATAASSPAALWKAVQRDVAAGRPGADPAALLARFTPVMSGHRGAAAALALAEKVGASLGAAVSPARRMDLLRAAFAGERTPRRRARLAARLAGALRDAGDLNEALALLEQAIAELAGAPRAELRRMRVELLGSAGRDRDLADALEADADDADSAAERAAALVARAAILDRSGEAERALELRLEALQVSPADGPVLDAARRRLEATGRLDRSLDLALAALPGVTERGARARLLRDIATLAEAAAGDRRQAASAWLDVLALEPADAAAAEAAERLLREVGDAARLAEFLGWASARQTDAAARAPLLWRLAEVRRVAEPSPAAALALYRAIAAESGGLPPGAEALAIAPEDWQRREDALALHSARALVAPAAAARAEALVARALVLLEAQRLAEADRDLARALELDSTSAAVIEALERIHERRGDWRGLRQRLQARIAAVASSSPALPAAATARLWLGIGRASERMNEGAAARAAYEKALGADESMRPALVALRQMAAQRNDWNEVARLLEREVPLVRAPAERGTLLVDLGVMLRDKLGRGARALEVLEAALAFQPGDARALDALYGAALSVGNWEKAAQALEAMLAAGAGVPDAAERYHRLGRAAEGAGQPDRALGLYSRSYARNPALRPTLERLSEICFERQQWDNAWKATEHLIDRHGADLDPSARATLALRSALADLHVAQRLAATNRIGSTIFVRGHEGGVRDVADTWASMRFEARLLGAIDGERRARALSRLSEVLSLTEAIPTHPARVTARETVAALVMVERRWAEAVPLLDALGAEEALPAQRRCLFLVTAGDIVLHRQGDVAGAAARYQQARVLNPAEPRLARAAVAQITKQPADGIEL
jgi:Tfp pilus assembly protein PilF